MESVEQEWIESPDGWGTNEKCRASVDGCESIDLFGNDDPTEYYTFTVHIDDNTAKTLRLQGFKLDSEETVRSTGVTLWQAAPRLATFLQNHPEACRGKSVLELGAGLGLCGIVAYFLGAQSVMMTDGDTHTLHQMRANVHRCTTTPTTDSNHITCRQLLWGSPHMETFAQHGKYDTILGADVVYTQDSIPPLLDTVACLLKKPHGQFVLSRFSKWNNVDDEIVIEAALLRYLACTRPSKGIFIFRWDEILLHRAPSSLSQFDSC